jgi:hypothetical protein
MSVLAGHDVHGRADIDDILYVPEEHAASVFGAEIVPV